MDRQSDFNDATESWSVIYASTPSDQNYVADPTQAQQLEGTAPLDMLPAQWWNKFWNRTSKNANAFKSYIGNLLAELGNLLARFSVTPDPEDSGQLADFFENESANQYLGGIYVKNTGGTVDGDLHVKGNLSVDGTGEEVITTDLKVGADTITLRDGNPSAMGTGEVAGIITENYDGNGSNNIIAVDKDGTARTGDIDIATRILYSSDGTTFYTDEEMETPAAIGAGEIVRDTGRQTAGGTEI